MERQDRNLQAAETKKWIADKGYPKPETDITELSE